MKKQQFNKDYANQVSEDQFVKEHLHMGSEDDLRGIHKELQVDKPKQEKKKPKEGE